MTRDAFLAHPVRWAIEGIDAEPEWVKAAWQNPAFREHVSEGLARSAEKLGSIEEDEATLELLSDALDREQVIALYEYLRDHGGREDEWRDEFEAFFQAHAGFLPAERE